MKPNFETKSAHKSNKKLVYDLASNSIFKAHPRKPIKTEKKRKGKTSLALQK
jgi:hypothetical protein